MKIQKINKKGVIALGQICILVMGFVAISYILGSSLDFVSADSGKTNVAAPKPTTVKLNTEVSVVDYLKSIGKGSSLVERAVLAEEHGIIDYTGTPTQNTELLGKLKEGSPEDSPIWNRIWNPSENVYVNNFAHGFYLGAILNLIPSIISAAKGEDVNWGEVLLDSAEAGVKLGTLNVAKTYVKNKIGEKFGEGVISQVFSGASFVIGAYMLVKFFMGFFVDSDVRIITVDCKSWQSEIGREHCEKYCEKCNNQEFPCEEYQCKSLGAGCELINKDTSYQECIFNYSKDVDAPELTAWGDALLEGYYYEPLDNELGSEIKYKGKECLPAYSVFSFGVELDKKGYCKIEKNSTKSFEDMTLDFGGSSLWKTQHKQWLAFPNMANLEEEIEKAGLEIDIDNNYKFYVRCENLMGHSNVKEFLFKFCIEDGPDTDQPEIVEFSLSDKTPVNYFEENDSNEIAIYAYLNEPSDCKWSHEDKSYSNMEYEMDCTHSNYNLNGQWTYPCHTVLKGLKNNFKNIFYFRCKDQPSANETERNTNKESYLLSLIGTKKLVIDSLEPNGTTVKDSTGEVKVTIKVGTSAGYNEGASVCYLSETGKVGSYKMFFEDGSFDNFYHEENLWLSEGEYKYYIKCLDLAGNMDSGEIDFRVESDGESPIVVRAYYEQDYLKLITNEEAECVYSPKDCSYSFEDGTFFKTVEDTSHFTDWNTQIDFHVKCKDKYDNFPTPPDACSIIVRPSDFYSE